MRLLPAWALLAASTGGFVAAAASDSPPLATPVDIIWGASFLAFPLVGLLLALKVPANAVGWLFLVGPAAVLWGVALDEMGYAPEPSGSVLALGMVALFSSLLVFPDGRYPNRWFRYAHLAVLAGLLIEPRISPATDGGISFAAALILTAGALVFRAITGTSTLRRQIALPIIVVVIGFGILFIAGSEWLGTLAITFVLVGVPGVIAVSVTRYRLYEIDRIVSRTVAYALVIGLLAAVYAGATVVLTEVLPVDSTLAVAASTLVVFSLFAPLRRRVQRVVDRRFNRTRYQAEKEVEAFTVRLRAATDVDTVEADLISVIDRTLQPSTVAVWIRGGVAAPAGADG